ncbi:MAG: hypothetical protein R3E66_01640 [bacterium]
MKRDQLKIASPCHENYDAMLGHGPQRFCESCSKHVTNLSEMTRDDAKAFLDAAKGSSVCVRYRATASGNVLFRAPKTDSFRRQVQGAKKLLTAAVVMVMPLMAACDREPVGPDEFVVEDTMIAAEQAILSKLSEFGLDPIAAYNEIDPFDPYENVVMGEIAAVDPIVEPVLIEEPVEDPVNLYVEEPQVVVMGDWGGEPEVLPEPEPEPVIDTMPREEFTMGKVAYVPD